MGGTEIDGHFEIAAHSHGELPQAVACGEFCQQGEMRTGGLVNRRNTHQSHRRKSMGVAQPLQETVQFVGRDAGLLGFLARIDLDQQLRRPAQLVHGLAERTRQLVTVEHFDHVKKGHSILGLVGLQRSDQVQPQVRMAASARNPVFFGLLDAIFAKDAVASSQRLIDTRFGLALADGRQCDSFRVATGGAAPLGDPVQEFGAAAGDTFWRLTHGH